MEWRMMTNGFGDMLYYGRDPEQVDKLLQEKGLKVTKERLYITS